MESARYQPSDYRRLIECGHGPIADMAMKCEAVLSTHSHALVSISGGADSDVMLDLVERVRTVTDCDVTYAWFDTGLEYRATKAHLDELEERYGIRIERRRAVKTIPVCCKEHGQPFLSKYVSTMCERLQRRGFAWEDEHFEALDTRYPNAKVALHWWTNTNTKVEGDPGWFDIGRIRWLKEFMLENPPWFRISAKCCDYAKKKLSRQVEREKDVDLVVHGVRRAEGGVRASHGACFDKGGRDTDTYRPLFWLSNSDRRAYAETFSITHSDCYAVWGFKRTGCACCPFGRELDHELDTLKRFEPNVAKAARKVFADAYEYTRMFHEYRDWRRTGMRRLF